MKQLDIFEAGRRARDEGMKKALDHAERESLAWGEIALEFLHRYCLSHERFMAWAVTHEAEFTKVVPTPPTTKAWGSLYHSAQERGWIVKDGVGEHPRRHGCYSPVWRSLIYRRAA